MHDDEDASCGCGGEHHGPKHMRYGGEHHGHRNMGCCCGQHGGWARGFPLLSIEEEVEVLGEMKAELEKRLEIVNKRLEVLKR